MRQNMTVRGSMTGTPRRCHQSLICTSPHESAAPFEFLLIWRKVYDVKQAWNSRCAIRHKTVSDLFYISDPKSLFWKFHAGNDIVAATSVANFGINFRGYWVVFLAPGSHATKFQFCGFGYTGRSRTGILLPSIQMIRSEYGGHVGYDDWRKHFSRAPNRADDVRAAAGENLLQTDNGDDEDEEADTKKKAKLNFPAIRR